MTREKEIEILSSLKGNTHFAEFFKDRDIDQMCVNVRNDYPIETGCAFREAYEEVLTSRKQAQKQHEEDVQNLVRNIIVSEQGDLSANLEKELIQATSRLFVIKVKNDNGYGLDQKEVGYLLTLIPR